VDGLNGASESRIAVAQFMFGVDGDQNIEPIKTGILLG
jgi:hypothetical protein